MAKDKTHYSCTECGGTSPKWLGKCPHCGAWNSLDEAIAAFTINAAYTNHLDTQTGSIETGKLADLVVLDQNLFEIPPSKISDTRALVTLFEGKTVHGDLSAL